jgi:hypothetical protein
METAERRLEQQPDLDRFLATHNPERLPGRGLGVEVGGASECLASGLDPPEPRQGEGLDVILGHVLDQDIPVPVGGEPCGRGAVPTRKRAR